MPGAAPHHPLPLPRGWPRRVRSAVIQVISLARTSLALTRGWASNSMNPQLRRQVEADRLQEEIGLLREEITERDLRSIVRNVDWSDQEFRWPEVGYLS